MRAAGLRSGSHRNCTPAQFGGANLSSTHCDSDARSCGERYPLLVHSLIHRNCGYRADGERIAVARREPKTADCMHFGCPHIAGSSRSAERRYAFCRSPRAWRGSAGPADATSLHGMRAAQVRTQQADVRVHDPTPDDWRPQSEIRAPQKMLKIDAMCRESSPGCAHLCKGSLASDAPISTLCRSTVRWRWINVSTDSRPLGH